MAPNATILLVEDNEMLQQVLARALEPDYQVLVAGDADTALLLHESHDGSIDLVISDVRLPSLGGAELAEELRRRDPRQPILLISGGFERATGFAELEKPFSIETLRLRVEEVVGAS